MLFTILEIVFEPDHAKEVPGAVFEKHKLQDSSPWLPCGAAGKESACSAGDLGLIPGLGRSPGAGKGTQSSILAWRMPWTMIHGVTKRQTPLSNFLFHCHRGHWIQISWNETWAFIFLKSFPGDSNA